jgi:hypothetical protein
MTVLRCTAKLLKRIKQAAKPPEPAPQDNPLGEWYADLDVWRRQPFVLILNAATGATLVLSGDAAGLRRLNERALLQFASLCEQFGLRGPKVDAELRGFDAGFAFGATRDRSLLGTLNRCRFETSVLFEHDGWFPAQAAECFWNGLFSHPALGRNARHGGPYHRPLDLLRERLADSVESLDLARRRARPPADR